MEKSRILNSDFAIIRMYEMQTLPFLVWFLDY